MKTARSFFVGVILLVVAVMAFPCFVPNAQAFRGGGGGRMEGGEREGEFGAGTRDGEAAVGPEGRAIAKGPEGNVYTGKVGDRLAVLPETAQLVAVGDQVYSVDGEVYYLPCEDDNLTYCVVPAPQ